MKKFFNSKTKMWMSILALTAVLLVGGTLAYLWASDGELTNAFSLAQVDTRVKEDLTAGKKEVTIENVGRSPVYVRARIMVSGVDPTKVQVVDTEPVAPNADTVYLVMPNAGGSSSGKDWQCDAFVESYTDEFYYFSQVLYGSAADATPACPEGELTATTSLLQKVVLGNALQNEKFLKDFSVTIYHESVLANEYPGTDMDNIAAQFDKADPEKTPAP